MIELSRTMRIAVLSDIHGNLLALEAVQRDLTITAPDLVVNLGDHLSGPLWARGTADLLMDQTEWIQIRGNHDRQLIELLPDRMGESDRAALEQLDSRHTRWLASLPAVARFSDNVFLCHGTPETDCEYLIEDVSSGFAKLAPANELRRRAGALTGAILCGHSHVPRFASIDRRTVVVNPGSVGLQAYEDSEHRFPHVIETGSPHGRYLVLDRHDTGWNATMRALAYDWDRASDLALAGRRPDWAHALQTGCVRR
jgi:predicted phosphodiesterase